MIPVTLMMAITLDGKIAKNSSHFANWTSPEDKKVFRKVSKEFGVFMVGENTYKTFPGPLPGRLNVVFSRAVTPKQEGDLKYVQGDPEVVLKDLEKMGYKKALLCGGANLNSLFLENKLIDEMIITIEPKIFGAGLSLFSSEFDADLELKSVEKINDNALNIRYKVIYK
ncbi:MAG: dihydrofolate reductase family protein [Parcubacteria group bacterium]